MTRDALEPWSPRPGEWDRGAAAHLLRRAGFGPRPGDLERALAEGHEATLARALDGGRDEELVASGEALLAAGSLESLQGWWMALIVGGGAPLQERLALLWHDHFATSFAKVGDVRLMHRQNALFRERGGGDFRALVHAVAKDPAMLVWLDGDDNRRGHPNENFARELMELFCLGIGHYSERDVQEAARAFTGWGTEGRSFAFRPELHDGGAKSVLGATGALTGERAVDAVLAHPACARHVARRLLEELVHPEPRGDEVDALSRVLVSAGFDVRAAVERVLRSALFFSPRARRSRIAGPVEVVAAAARALGARVAPVRLARAAEEAGQALFRPPSVKGWDGGERWIRADAWLARHEALARLARAHAAPEDGVRVDLRAAFGDPSRADVPRAVADALLPDGAAPELLDVLGRAASERGDVDEALALATALVLTAPEYHLY